MGTGGHGKTEKTRGKKKQDGHEKTERHQMFFILSSYLEVDALPGFPLLPGGPRSPFWPGMIEPGKPGGP